MNYSADLRCKNCKRVNWLVVEKGKSVRDHCLDDELKCPNCDVVYFKEEENDAKAS